MKRAPTLSDFITFECEPQSMMTDTEADILERKIADVVGIDEKHKHRRTLASFCVVYTCTRNVKLHQTDRVDPSVIALYDAWVGRENLTLVELWQKMRQQIPHTLWNEWFRQWDETQRLFEVDPAQLPDDQLSGEQKVELKDPKSPLAEGDEPSPSSSSAT